MTTSSVLIINPAAPFDDQVKAAQGLLHLVSDGIDAMGDSVTPVEQQAIIRINEAVIDWIAESLTKENRASRGTPRLAVAG